MNLARTLLQHRWKAFLRSPSLGQRLVGAFLLGMVVLLLGVSLFALGQNLDKVFAQLLPNRDPVVVIHQGVLYYLLFDLVGRYFVQGMPVANIAAYRHLPIRRSALVRFVLGQVPLTLFNALPWLVVGPFVVTLIYPQFGGGAALGWLVAFGALLLISSYLVFFARLQVAVRPARVLIALSLLMLLLLLDRSGVIPLSTFSKEAFGALAIAPAWAAVPASLSVILVVGIGRWMSRGFYLEDIPARPASTGLQRLESARLRQRYGVEGLLLLNELKLIARHRRSRTVVVSSLLIIIAYALLFYPDETDVQLGNSSLILPGVAITGSIMLTYGQFLLAWEGAHFDGMLAANVSARTYLKSKHRLLSSFCLVNYLLTLPLGGLGWPILVVNSACFLFNWGVSSWLVVYFAISNRERVDMKSGSLFNWQGVSTSQMWLSILILLIPVLLGSLANWWIPGGGVILISGLGLLGWLTRGYWLREIIRRFWQEKYPMAAGFRQKPT